MLVLLLLLISRLINRSGLRISHLKVPSSDLSEVACLIKSVVLSSIRYKSDLSISAQCRTKKRQCNLYTHYSSDKGLKGTITFTFTIHFTMRGIIVNQS